MDHEVFMEGHQLLPDALWTGTLVLLILEVQQHVYLERHTSSQYPLQLNQTHIQSVSSTTEPETHPISILYN